MFSISKWNNFWGRVGPMGYGEVCRLTGEFISEAIEKSEIGFDHETYTHDDLKSDIDLLLSNAPVSTREFAIERLYGYAFMYELQIKDPLVFDQILRAFRSRSQCNTEARLIRVLCRIWFDSLTNEISNKEAFARVTEFKLLMMRECSSTAEFMKADYLPWDHRAFPELLGDSEYDKLIEPVDLRYLSEITNPSDVVYLRMSYRHEEDGDLSEGIEKLNRIIENDPSVAEYWFCRGGIYFTLGLYAQAKADFETYMSIRASEYTNHLSTALS